LRLVGFVELVVFEIGQAIDGIDENINPIDENFISTESAENIAGEKPWTREAGYDSSFLVNS